jgi:hypothetical protein
MDIGSPMADYFGIELSGKNVSNSVKRIFKDGARRSK